MLPRKRRKENLQSKKEEIEKVDVKDGELKRKMVMERFEEHLDNSDFKHFLFEYWQSLSPDMLNLINLVSTNDMSYLESKEFEENPNNTSNIPNFDKKIAEKRKEAFGG